VGYDDLTAIDWIFEYTKERQRKRLLYASGQGILGHLRQLVDGTDIWLVLVLTGVATAIIAACIDIAANWLADLKIGYCKNSGDGEGFYLNKGFCCWGHEGADRCAYGSTCMYSTNGYFPDLSDCQGWTPWRTALGIKSNGGGYVVEYLFYTLYSVCCFSMMLYFLLANKEEVLFAACASILVGNYARYAKHSGIPEIKTVLGGFVIRRFMSVWTLVIKSLGLVSLLFICISCSMLNT
jgi:chloride channel 3/4/5